MRTFADTSGSPIRARYSGEQTMPFLLPIDTITELGQHLNLLGASKRGTAYECRKEAKANYEVLKAAARGRCTWTQAIIGATVHRADPNPLAMARPFPHRCGHDALLVEAREGTYTRCFILDTTVVQWDLPLAASHVPASARRDPWNEYFDQLHSKAMPMNPVPVRGTIPMSAAHILASGPDRNTTFMVWANAIARHPFATNVDGMYVMSTADSDSMIP